MTDTVTMVLNRVVVSIYKVLGFVILTGILVWLGTYIFSNVFFLFSRSWIAPTVVSPSDEPVRELTAELAHALAQRDQLHAERRTLQAQLDDAGRVLTAERAFQNAYRAAIRDDLHASRDAQRELAALVKEYRAARENIQRSNKAYAALSEQRTARLHEAGLIDDDGMIAVHHQLAEMLNANVSLSQKSVELGTHLESLDREVKALDAMAENRRDAPLSYDLLATRHEYDKSIGEAKKAIASQQALTESIGALDASIARYEGLAAAIRQSPYLVAGDQNILVAFVPYENLKRVRPEQPIYACSFGPVWCHWVGTTGQLLGGEVLRRHVFHERELRGRMIHIVLANPEDARTQSLYVGGAPLFL